MIFFDSSALLPLFLEEEHSRKMRALVREDPALVVWWGSTIECFSAFARLRRERIIHSQQESDLRTHLAELRRHWIEIQPGNDVKAIAQQLLLQNPLTAADSLQLAAALLWADKLPSGHRFAGLDAKLLAAAHSEGFLTAP